MYARYVKRILDFWIAFLGLLLTSWLFLLIAILIKSTSKGKVLFKQNRTGKDNEPFAIYKFRTMRIDTPKDVPTHLLKDPQQYITGIGNILRKMSLDELPQLINILIGEMAIVGPRPSLLTQSDLNAYRDMNHASSVRPGLTGLAQISGRDELEICKKAALDGEYIKSITFLNDVRICIKTFTLVLKRDGVKEGKH